MLTIYNILPVLATAFLALLTVGGIFGFCKKKKEVIDYKNVKANWKDTTERGIVGDMEAPETIKVKGSETREGFDSTAVKFSNFFDLRGDNLNNSQSLQEEISSRPASSLFTPGMVRPPGPTIQGTNIRITPAPEKPNKFDAIQNSELVKTKKKKHKKKEKITGEERAQKAMSGVSTMSGSTEGSRAASNSQDLGGFADRTSAASGVSGMENEREMMATQVKKKKKGKKHKKHRRKTGSSEAMINAGPVERGVSTATGMTYNSIDHDI